MTEIANSVNESMKLTQTSKIYDHIVESVKGILVFIE